MIVLSCFPFDSLNFLEITLFVVFLFFSFLFFFHFLDFFVLAFLFIFSCFCFFCKRFFFLGEGLFFGKKRSLHSGRSKITRRTVGRDTDQLTKVFEFVKFILRPKKSQSSQVNSQDTTMVSAIGSYFDFGSGAGAKICSVAFPRVRAGGIVDIEVDSGVEVSCLRASIRAGTDPLHETRISMC